MTKVYNFFFFLILLFNIGKKERRTVDIKMLLSFIILNSILFGSGQAYFDDILFDIQNQNRFNPYAYGPPPIFYV